MTNEMRKLMETASKVKLNEGPGGWPSDYNKEVQQMIIDLENIAIEMLGKLHHGNDRELRDANYDPAYLAYDLVRPIEQALAKKLKAYISEIGYYADEDNRMDR